MHIIDAYSFRPFFGTTRSHYEYSSSGVLQRSITTGLIGPADTIVYTFSNGDLIQQSGNSGTLHYTYYTDKAVPTSGYITQQGLDYGSAYIYRNTHLLKSIEDGSGATVYTCSYIYDNKGNVTGKMGMDLARGGADTTRYGYLCAVE